MLEDRRQVDPENRYPSEGLREVEREAARLLEMFPDAAVARTRDVLQLDIGGDEGVVLVLTAESLEIRLPTVEWTMGAYGPADASRFWKRVKWDRLSDRRLQQLVKSGIEARLAEFVACRFCGERLPPEYRHRDVCHGCAEKHMGIVH